MLAEPDVYRHPAFLSYRVAIKQNEILGKFWHLCMIDALNKTLSVMVLGLLD